MVLALSQMGKYTGKMNIYLGIDPGIFKVGWAFVSGKGELLLSGIISRSDFEEFFLILENSNWYQLKPFVIEGFIETLPDVFQPEIILGGGTSSDFYLGLLKSKGYIPRIVSEYGTTLGARSLYWELHPPRGIRKLIPISLRLPPREIDDLAAWKIVLNALIIPE